MSIPTTKDRSERFSIGANVSIDEIMKSVDWKLKSFSPDPYNTSSTYVRKDGKAIVHFDHEQEFGVVEEKA